MLALTEVCIALGSVIESNTLFLLAAASYMVGIVIRELGRPLGGAFYLAGVLLGILITPNKLYVLSYGVMGLYILLREYVGAGLGKLPEGKRRDRIFLVVRILLFNGIYLLLLFAGRDLLFAGNGSGKLIGFAVMAGQVGFLIYDLAYEYVQKQIWTKIRGRLQ